MEATKIAAWIGAVTGMSGLGWDVYKWKTSGPRLRVMVRLGLRQIGGPRSPQGEVRMGIRVQNIGTGATTITTVALTSYDSWWKRKRLERRDNSALLPVLNGVPHKIGPGEQWDATVIQTEQVNDLIDTGKMFLELYHSTARNPILLHVPPKD